MVCHSRWFESTDLADQIALDDESSELLVSCAVVSALCCCASGLIGIRPMPGASAAFGGGVEFWACVD